MSEKCGNASCSEYKFDIKKNITDVANIAGVKKIHVKEMNKSVEEFKNIIVSDSKQNIVVITKLDKTSSYEEYKQNNYDGFIEDIIILDNYIV